MNAGNIPTLASRTLFVFLLGCASQGAPPRLERSADELHAETAEAFNQNLQMAAQSAAPAQFREEAALQYFSDRFELPSVSEKIAAGKVRIDEIEQMYHEALGQIERDPTLSPEAKRYLVNFAREKRDFAARKGALTP